MPDHTTRILGRKLPLEKTLDIAVREMLHALFPPSRHLVCESRALSHEPVTKRSGHPGWHHECPCFSNYFGPPFGSMEEEEAGTG